ncbi:MAG: DsbA family oxidoreductase [Geminicoccaceae bacterium]
MAVMDVAITVDIIGDVVCPWCYVGLERLRIARQQRPAHPLRLRWRPFMLNPGLPARGVPRDVYLASKFGGTAGATRAYQAIAAAGRALDLPFAFDRIRVQPQSARAHMLLLDAQAHGQLEPALSALFRAFTVDGQDIGDLRVLRALAERLGLEDSLALSCDDATCMHHIGAYQSEAQRLGISGVPVFVFEGRDAISGAQAPEAIAAMIDLAAGNRAADAVQGRQAS